MKVRAHPQAELDTLQTRLQELADGGELPGDDAEVATDMALALATGELAPMAQVGSLAPFRQP